MADAPVLYTLGHSTRGLDELVALLRAHGIERLVDIRTVPRSRTNPQFDHDGLERDLPAQGIAYAHDAALGGLRPKSKTIPDDVNGAWKNRSFHNYADHALGDAFQRALERLLDTAAREATAIMCAEAVWWRCHRRIVADHALARGTPVVHLFDVDKSEPATMTPFAAIGEDGVVTYPETAG